MLAMILQIELLPSRQAAYLPLAARFKARLEQQSGSTCAERWQVDEHRQVQAAGRQQILANYRRRAAQGLRDDGMHEPPANGRCAHVQGLSR